MAPLLSAAQQTAPPVRLNIPKSTTQFFEVPVANHGLFIPINYDGSVVNYRNARDPGNAITNGDFIQARGGVCFMPTNDSWWVNVQGASGSLNFVLMDFLDLAAAIAFMQSLVGASPNLRTMSAPTFATVGVASAQALAANPTRAFLYLKNTQAAGTGSKISISFNGAAVLNSGVTLFDGEAVVFDLLDGVTVQVVNAIADAAGRNLAIQEST